jgi:hypothetical protein
MPHDRFHPHPFQFIIHKSAAEKGPTNKRSIEICDSQGGEDVNVGLLDSNAVHDR